MARNLYGYLVLIVLIFMVLCILIFSAKTQTKSYGAIKTNYLVDTVEKTKSDTIKFNLIGTDDSTKVTSSLKLSDITIIVGTTTLSQSDIGSIALGEISYPETNRATCQLTLKGVPGEGQLKIKIAGGTLTDRAGNTNSEATLVTEVTMCLANAKTVAANPDAFYGKTVNYSGYSSSYSDGWQIFDSDGTNIYLIAKDYISYAQAPQSANYTLTKSGSSDYGLALINVRLDYSGTHESDRAVAFIADTNVWKIFKTGNADWATGGPTIQQFAASYQKTHASKYIEYNLSTYGYQVKWSTDTSYNNVLQGLDTEEYNNLYVITSFSRTANMWLASPSAAGNGGAIMLSCYGSDGSRYLSARNFNDTYPSFRPLVCLNSGVKLTAGTTCDYDIST